MGRHNKDNFSKNDLTKALQQVSLVGYTIIVVYHLAPELGLDPEVLPPGPVAGGGVAGGNGRMVRHLLAHEPEAPVVTDAFVGFTWKSEERPML